MNELLARKNMKTLDRDVVIIPSGGTRNIMPLASMLVGNDLKLAVLLDGDQPGIQKEKQLKEKLLVNCLLVGSFAGKDDAEIEDLFLEEFYMKALKKAYPGKEVQFSEEEKSIAYITKRVEQAFERLKLDGFEKGKVANVLVDWIQKDSGGNKISDNTCKTFEKIFTKVNTLPKEIKYSRKSLIRFFLLLDDFRSLGVINSILDFFSNSSEADSSLGILWNQFSSKGF